MPTRQVCHVYLAKQVSDILGPVMAPDVIGSQHVGDWSLADRTLEYNTRLASSGSAKVGGRHYASLCFHRVIPSDCLVIDGVHDAFVNILVDCAPVNRCTDQKSVVMVQYMLSPDLQPNYLNKDRSPYFVGEELAMITHQHNSIMRQAMPIDSARCKKNVE